MKKEYYEKNKDAINAKRREKYQKNPEKYKLESKRKYEKHREKILEGYRLRWKTDPEFKRKRMIRNKENRSTPEYKARRNMLARAKLKMEKDRVYQILGGYICSSCGYDKNRHAIQIDHIKGDGGKLRKKGYTYLTWKNYADNPEKAKEDLQVMCANCNQIKKFEKEEF